MEFVLVQLHGSLAQVNYRTKAFLFSGGLGSVRSLASLCGARLCSTVDIGILRAAAFFQRLLHQVQLDFEGGNVLHKVWRRRGINAQTRLELVELRVRFLFSGMFITSSCSWAYRNAWLTISCSRPCSTAQLPISCSRPYMVRWSIMGAYLETNTLITK